jgi:hypothetical protein
VELVRHLLAAYRESALLALLYLQALRHLPGVMFAASAKFQIAGVRWCCFSVAPSNL